MKPLPEVMVAPNGARKIKADHPAIPMTIAETVETARLCHAAGAGGIHAHVRDAAGEHVLDAGLYRELLEEMAVAVPQMAVQITTEAIGKYSPDAQRALVRDVNPAMVSIALREMLPEGVSAEATDFYHWANEADIAVQHIIYDRSDINMLDQLLRDKCVPEEGLQALLVLGRYTTNQVSDPDDLPPLITALTAAAPDVDWAVCAFGQGETACLKGAIEAGGKARVGFENSLVHSDGSIAKDNAERVLEISKLLKFSAGEGRS